MHDSAHLHVSGQAEYIDDIAEPAGCLHAAIGWSDIAHGTLNNLPLDDITESAGIVSVITADDLIGENDISPTDLNDEPVFATDTVSYHGQPLFAVVATHRELARKAANAVQADITPASADVTIDDVVNSTTGAAHPSAFVTSPLTLQRGDATTALAVAPHQLTGTLRVGGQDHFYLEGHIALAVPGEDGSMLVYSSTQHPSEVQHMVAHALGVKSHLVTVQVRRMGGGFGGKETQSNLFAVIAAIAARKTSKAVKLRPDRDDDMRMTGKRHDFRIDYKVGFDDEGVIHAVEALCSARCGYSADLSGPVTDRALFHADNAYYYPNVRLRSQPLKTHTVSNTAFRGFGGPQGLLAAERIIEEVAFHRQLDPLTVRQRNFYSDDACVLQQHNASAQDSVAEHPPERNVTPYHQLVKDNIISRLVNELVDSSSYLRRREEILHYNSQHRFKRRGIALTPVKFGISFTATWYNQGGALIHIYRDGSILLNHGGTEMGQGLFTKVAQVVADVFGVAIDTVRITATRTDKVPNTSATAASSGTDLNAMAALNAANTLRERLVAVAATEYGVARESIRFHEGAVELGHKTIGFAELSELAYMQRVSLSATGFYKTPDIHWDRESGRGNPFYYFAYGAAVTEVSIDLLTGEYKVLRADILHDVGKSLNPAIDIGQIEGGYVQGLGWLTTEELWWDKNGALKTHAPSTYKIPLASDIPEQFNVELAEWSENPARTIRRSKAVGEPPLMLAASVVEALSMAVASVSDYTKCPRLDTPVTPEVVLLAVSRLRQMHADAGSKKT